MFIYSSKFIALAAVACLALPFGNAVAADRAEEALVSGQASGEAVESMEAPDGAEAPTTCEVPPGTRYVSRDPAKCAVIKIVCDPGYEQFSNECGCGCQPIAQ
jgi:hypothetical protein